MWQFKMRTRNEEKDVNGETEAAGNDNNDDDDDFEVTMTVNSYSGLADVTVDSASGQTAATAAATVKPSSSSSSTSVGIVGSGGGERFNEMRTRLIGELIEMEANFVSYLSAAVATFSRPLRGFFMQQHDYFTLFQNTEKILVISENFLRSMDKWSAYDLYTRIGQLYSHKMALFRDAYTLYARGHASARSLLADLRRHSKQFRLFLDEVESAELSLERSIDLPVAHVQRTLDIFKRIRAYTLESRRNPAEAPHIDSVIFELRAVLANLSTPTTTTTPTTTPTIQGLFDDDVEDELDDEMTTLTSLDGDYTLSTVSHGRSRDDLNSCCSSSSSSSSSCSSFAVGHHHYDNDEDDYSQITTLFVSPIHHF